MKRFFNNLKLAKKMLLAPIVVLIFLLLLAGGTFYSLSMQKAAMNDIYNNRFQQFQNTARILNDMSSAHGNLSRILNWIKLNLDPQKISEASKKQKDLLAADAELIKKILASPALSAEERKMFQAALDNLVEYQKGVIGVIDAAAMDVNMAIQLMTMTDDKHQVLTQFLTNLLAFEDKLSKETYNESITNINRSMTAFLVVVLIAVILSFLVSISVTHLVLQPIRETIGVMRKLAEGDLTQNIDLDAKDEIGELVESVNTMRVKMGDAVGEALQISDVLTDAASQEAAAIEQTSASLDEIAQMTRQNASNTTEANQLMLSAREAINKANGSMTGLTSSMMEIAKASEQTQKIVKSIDEIAFQTNLLALNASVEAARAGEAGAGFAVVADEVRNLAMRATESARGSSNLISDIVNKVKTGESLVGATSTAFGQVTKSSEKVVELMGEIAAASQEQSQGIGQVNSAIAEMNITTQQNAGNAERLSNVMAMFKTGSQRQNAGRERFSKSNERSEPGKVAHRAENLIPMDEEG